jgi:hypothetical protein
MVDEVDHGWGWVSAWVGVSCASARCGRASLKWCRYVVRICRKWRSLMIRIRSSNSRRSVCDHPFTDRVRPRCSGWTGREGSGGRPRGRGLRRQSRAAGLAQRARHQLRHGRVLRCPVHHPHGPRRADELATSAPPHAVGNTSRAVRAAKGTGSMTGCSSTPAPISTCC